MIICPECSSEKWRYLYRSPVDPAKDAFKCKECGHKFHRYDEVKINQIQHCPYCGQDECYCHDAVVGRPANCPRD